jgi:hypothetical protein
LVEPYPYTALKVQPLPQINGYAQHLQPEFNGDMWPWGVTAVMAQSWNFISVNMTSGLTTLHVKTMLPYQPELINAFDPFDNAGRLASHQAYQPLFKVPSEILSADPAWGDCELKLYQRATRLIPLATQATSAMSQVEMPTGAAGSASPKFIATTQLPLKTSSPQA